MILRLQIVVRKATGMGYSWWIEADGRPLPGANGGGIDVKDAAAKAVEWLRENRIES